MSHVEDPQRAGPARADFGKRHESATRQRRGPFRVRRRGAGTGWPWRRRSASRAVKSRAGMSASTASTGSRLSARARLCPRAASLSSGFASSSVNGPTAARWSQLTWPTVPALRGQYRGPAPSRRCPCRTRLTKAAASSWACGQCQALDMDSTGRKLRRLVPWRARAHRRAHHRPSEQRTRAAPARCGRRRPGSTDSTTVSSDGRLAYSSRSPCPLRRRYRAARPSSTPKR